MVATSQPQSTAPGSAIPSAPIKGNQPARVVPFRLATLERTEILPLESNVLTTAQQPIQRVIEGTGFVFGTALDVVNTTAGNAAAVAFYEDAPQSALAQVTMDDPSGQIVNLSGYDLFLSNLGHKQYAFRNTEADTEITTAITGAGATGGSFSFFVRVPVGINRKTLLGILANQDRSVKFSLRTDYNIGTPGAATGPIYTTAPTNPGTMVVNKYYENYAVPPSFGPAGQNQIMPDGFGTLSFLTSSIADAPPIGGTTVNHYLRRIGNTIRYIILVFRVNGVRATVAGAVTPNRIALKVGDTDVFNESWRYRRALMFERYGFTWPAGVLIYDAMHDFVPGAGNELGMDWYNTQNVNTAQFQITYPVAFGSTNNSLKFITSDLALVGQPVGS